MPGKTICLFDVDGTLTAPRQEVKQNMLDTLKAVHAKGISLGVVGGSDIAKITEQLGPGLLQYEFLDFVFSENGLLGFADGKEIHRQNIKAQFGEKTYQEFAKSVLKMIADLDIPVMTGTFIEVRVHMTRGAAVAECEAAHLEGTGGVDFDGGGGGLIPSVRT